MFSSKNRFEQGLPNLTVEDQNACRHNLRVAFDFDSFDFADDANIVSDVFEVAVVVVVVVDVVDDVVADDHHRVSTDTDSTYPTIDFDSRP